MSQTTFYGEPESSLEVKVWGVGYVDAEKVAGRTITSFRNGQIHGTTPGMITPKHVANFIKASKEHSEALADEARRPLRTISKIPTS